MHRGEPVVGERGDVTVVESDDRDVVGDGEPGLGEHRERTDGTQIARAHECRRAFVPAHDLARRGGSVLLEERSAKDLAPILEPEVLHGAQIRGGAISPDDAALSADIGDVAVAERDEMLDDQSQRLVVVDVHVVTARVVVPLAQEHGRDAARRLPELGGVRIDVEREERLDPFLDQAVDDGIRREVRCGRAEGDPVSALGCGADQPFDHAHLERAAHPEDRSDELRAVPTQQSGRRIGAVAEFAGRGEDPLARLLRGARLVAHDHRDERAGDPCTLGDVGHGGVRHHAGAGRRRALFNHRRSLACRARAGGGPTNR
ncbi:hypothetical protein GCM10009588_02380 [Microbacterium phyllosphaerae]